jgi:hypothetical protein
MLPLLPIGIAALVGTSFWFAKNRKDSKATMSAERAIIYSNALQLKDPEKMRTMAAAFGAEGLTECQKMLEKRATLRELPQEVKAARAAAFKVGMNSQNSEEVFKLAKTFDDAGCTGAAEALRTYAAGL